ncbi:MAG: PilZ domain-containing protein [Myxococcales bacterium]
MREILLSARDRSVLRRLVRMPCQVVEEECFSLLASETLDVSVTGMRVRAIVPAAVGTKVLVSFRVPGSSLYIDVDAEVVRVLWGRRKGDQCSALGLRFLNLSRIDRAILGSRLQGLPPPRPERELRFDYASTVLSLFNSSIRSSFRASTAPLARSLSGLAAAPG